MATRRLTFSPEERKRIAEICKVLGITFAEFIHRATMHHVDEWEADVREAINQYGREHHAN